MPEITPVCGIHNVPTDFCFFVNWDVVGLNLSGRGEDSNYEGIESHGLL